MIEGLEFLATMVILDIDLDILNEWIIPLPVGDTPSSCAGINIQSQKGII